MSFLRSPARRSVLRVTGVLITVLLVAAAPSAYAFAARAGPGQKVSGRRFPASRQPGCSGLPTRW